MKTSVSNLFNLKRFYECVLLNCLLRHVTVTLYCYECDFYLVLLRMLSYAKQTLKKKGGKRDTTISFNRFMPMSPFFKDTFPPLFLIAPVIVEFNFK